MENKAQTIASLEKVCLQLREDVLKMVYTAGSGHIGGSFSAAEIMTVLFFHEMNINPEINKWEDRDRFILSKGHCCPILYSALCRRGYFEEDKLLTLRQLHSPLQGHPDMRKLPALDMSSGSLGNGLSLGLGMALATRALHKDYRVFVLMGDGEQQEGAIWEAAMAAKQMKVGNLIGIVDYNKIQLTGHTADVIDVTPLADKWRAFGWNVVEINGNDISAVLDAFEKIRSFNNNLPSVIIADTVKGKGVSFMEDEVVWHSKAPSTEEYEKAKIEIEK
jgi:transketolase